MDKIPTSGSNEHDTIHDIKFVFLFYWSSLRIDSCVCCVHTLHGKHGLDNVVHFLFHVVWRSRKYWQSAQAGRVSSLLLLEKFNFCSSSCLMKTQHLIFCGGLKYSVQWDLEEEVRYAYYQQRSSKIMIYTVIFITCVRFCRWFFKILPRKRRTIKVFIMVSFH